jgi:hypothetical protein
MTRPNRGSWFTLAALGLAALGCEAGGVGDPCTPEDEYQQEFSGYSREEVNTESRSFQCETRLCLVNHFQGRASCPYGQSPDEIATLAPDDPARCKIPGTSGTDQFDSVTVPVDPQRTGRRAEDTVYCSCRCANAEGSTDDGARYCECPSGYDCEKLVDDLGLGKAQLAGSYCIKQGTKYNPTRIGTPCERAIGNCDE